MCGKFYPSRSCDGSGMARFTKSVLLPMILATQHKPHPELNL